MNCCVECFSDTQIKDMIRAKNVKGNCDFCHQGNTFVYSVDEQSDLSDLIGAVLSVYEEADNGEPLFSLVLNDWAIFNKDAESSQDLITAFCKIIYGAEGIPYNRKVCIPQESIEKNGIFAGHSWSDFSNAIKAENRFHNGYFKPNLFAPFLEYPILNYKKGKEFYRARVCNNRRGYAKENMGEPPFEKRKPGRVNSDGIGVLYLTSDEQTALNEVRANMFDFVTVGTFQLLRDIQVVNISDLNKISPVLYSGAMESLAANTKMFTDIAKAIAKPMRRSDSVLEYLPTQYIADFIKSKGYDGVVYASTMGTGGYNIAAFDDTLFGCIAVKNMEITKVEYAYDRIE